MIFKHQEPTEIMPPRNAFYAQSGGVTAVINASACGVIQAARANSDRIGSVLVGRNGILGALREELIDTRFESDALIEGLRHTPGSAFGSCRHKMPDPLKHPEEYERLFDVFAAHDIGYFFYNGGNDSSDTSLKVARAAEQMGYPLQCIGIPKTVDNDLPLTDCCPGFGSAAKYIATSILEASLDLQSMCETSTKVFILEVMGRHAGWIAAAAGLAQDGEQSAPQIILLPEVAFDEARFLDRVREVVERDGFCSIVASEGAQTADGHFLTESALKDAFGHTQLGGLAPMLASLIRDRLGYRYHWAVADYLQRSARHLASATDLEQAWAVGKAAVDLALTGENAVMPVIVRTNDTPYQWHIDSAPLEQIANVERKLPPEFIREDGFGITAEARRYLQPLIEGEAYPPYEQGRPCYVRLQNTLVPKRLPGNYDL